MDALLTGIYARYNAANSFKTACTGGLHLNRSPQGTSMPYAIYRMLPSYQEPYLQGHFVIARVEFHIYAATNAVVQDLATKLMARFDDCRPTIAGYDSLIMENVLFYLDDTLGDEGGIYRYIVEYEIRIDKN